MSCGVAGAVCPGAGGRLLALHCPHAGHLHLQPGRPAHRSHSPPSRPALRSVHCTPGRPTNRLHSTPGRPLQVLPSILTTSQVTQTGLSYYTYNRSDSKSCNLPHISHGSFGHSPRRLHNTLGTLLKCHTVHLAALFTGHRVQYTWHPSSTVTLHIWSLFSYGILFHTLGNPLLMSGSFSSDRPTHRLYTPLSVHTVLPPHSTFGSPLHRSQSTSSCPLHGYKVTPNC
jgi:hypothetical protein